MPNDQQTNVQAPPKTINNHAAYAFGALTLLLVFGVLFLVKGFLHAIILGVIGATMLMPIHRRILRLVSKLDRRLRKINLCRRKDSMLNLSFGDRRKRLKSFKASERRTASLFSVCLVFTCVLIPVMLLLITVVHQGQSTLRKVRVLVTTVDDNNKTHLENKLQELDAKYNLSEHWRKFREMRDMFNFDEASGDEDATLEEIQQGEVKQEDARLEDVQILNVQKDDVQIVEVQKEDLQKVEPADEAGIDKVLPKSDSKKPVNQELHELVSYLVSVFQNFLRSMLKTLLGIIKQTWMLVVNFFIMLVVMFFAFRDGDTLVQYVRRISPLDDDVQEMIIDRVSEVSRAVLYGILGTAIVQSLIAMVVFRIVGIPALLWGSLLGMCSLIPFVGTSLIWVPILIYFLLIGQPGNALIVLAGCGGVVANVDNFMRPAFICGGRTGMSYIVLFCSLLGGLQAFGLAGVVYGPLISGLCALCLYIFATQYKGRKFSE